MIRRISKLRGIYKITNIINGKVYIGRSINILLRWYNHIDALNNNEHNNKKLQDDFNNWGLDAFHFSILEMNNDEKALIVKEQEYLNNLDFDNNYNRYNSVKEFQPDISRFVKYINSKWLLPEDCEDKREYAIYGKSRDEIVKIALECDLLPFYASYYTFNRVINFMKNTLGYVIESGRLQVKRKKYTYKLIVDFDEDYMEENKHDDGSI